MAEQDDWELVEHKALAQRTIDELTPLKEKLSKICARQIEELNQTDKDIEFAPNFSVACELYNKSEKLTEELKSSLLKLSKIKTLIMRNEQRKEYISKILSGEGIYNEQVDKKKLDEIEKSQQNEIDLESVGLNCGSKTKRYLGGNLLTFEGEKFDLSLPENIALIKSVDEKSLHKIVFTFPECVSSAGAELLSVTRIKKLLLKEIASYAYDEAKQKSYSEINKDFGGLLSFRKQIPADVESFVVGVMNMFDCQVKQYLLERFSFKKNEINEALKCNENSELIPENKLKVQKAEENETLSAVNDELKYDETVQQPEAEPLSEPENNLQPVEQADDEENSEEILEDVQDVLKSLGIDLNVDDEEGN